MRPKTNHKLTFAIKAFLVAVVLTSIFSTLSGYQNKLVLKGDMDWRFFSAGIFGCLLYRIFNANGWSLVLKSINQKLPALIALKVWLISEACRWLPGSIWNYGSRVYQAKQHGIKPATAAASLFLELALTVSAWFSVAIIGLITYRDIFTNKIQALPENTLIAWGSVAVVVFLILFWKPLSSKFLGKYGELHGRFLLLMRVKLRPKYLLGVFFYYLLMCLVNGIAFYCVLQAVAPDSNVPILAAIGANGAAWLIGFFAFLAPGGLVVREGTLVAILVAWVPTEHAITVAILWRIVQIIIEIFCVLGAYCLIADGVVKKSPPIDVPLPKGEILTNLN